MPSIPFAVGAYRRNASRLPEMRLVNGYLETTKQGDVYLLARPALADYATVGAGPIRGVFAQAGTFAGAVLTVSGTVLYKDSTALGIIPGSRRVIMAATSSLALIATGAGLYSTDGTTISEVSFPDGAGVSWVGRLGGYLIAIRANDSQRFYWSTDGTTWQALDFASAERKPDPLVGGLVIDDILVLFGTETVEFFAQTSDADAPFQRIEQRMYSRGCASVDTIALVDNAAMWVTDDLQVVRGGSVPERVSTNSIEERIAASTSLSAFRLSWQGHEFYVLQTSQGSFAWDASTQEWAEFASYGRAAFRAHVATMVGSAPILGDAYAGKLYTLTDDSAEDAGEPIQRIFTAIANTDKPFSCFNLTLDAAVGQTADLTGQGAEPEIEMRWSDDYGNTWGPWEAVSLGAQGEYRARPVWLGLGLIDAPGRVHEFRLTDPAPWRISRVAINEDLRGAAR